jgi:DNA-directed RNA polymerase specialized sigma24 family protein
MIDSGSLQSCECERRLVNLFNESHKWLLQSANKVTKNKVESECLVQELYIYLHEKCNPKLFWGEHSYNLYYCSKFLHSRFINKTKKLNRIRNVGLIGQDYTPWEQQDDIEYDIEYDERLQKAHDEVLDAIKDLKNTKTFASAMIWEMYYMSDDTLDEVAKKIGISKSTTFLAVRKVRRILKEIIDNPFQ